MEEHENLYDKIKEIIGKPPESLNILEETIDLDTQLEYFENARQIKSCLDQEEVMREAESLFNHDLSPEETKILLSRLASVDMVEAFRIIERYMKNPDPLARDWGILALQESKMLIESKLLDENQVFISTGLGGKGNKLRYFVVLLANRNIPFNTTQKKIVKIEFEHILSKYGGEIEEYCFREYIATLMTIIPMDVTIKSVLNEAIDDCNQYGNFLVENFIITNVKELSFDEIIDFLQKSRKEK